MMRTATYTTYIVATPAKVWDALTNGVVTQKYFFGRMIESDWQVGSPWKLVMEDGVTDSEGLVTACIPCAVLSYTWRVVWVPEFKDFPEGHVTWYIEDMDHGVTRLRLEQAHGEGMPQKWIDAGQKGWAAILSGLKTLLETGKPLPPLDLSR